MENKIERKYFQFQNIKLSYLDSNTNSDKTILITHANGYSSDCYLYLIEHLMKDYRVLALDFASHGMSETSLDFEDWFFLRDQILKLIEVEKLTNIISIGHSMGGSTAVLCSKKHPELFKKMILFDPTFLSIKILLYKVFFDFPIATKAKNRRPNFKSLDLIRRVFKKFPIYANWNERVFEDYLNSCFKKKDDEYILSCSPEAESKYFRTTSFQNFKNYGKNKIETHIIIPKNHLVCSPYRAKKIISGNTKSSLEIGKDLTHFFPFEKIEFTLERVSKLLEI